MAELIGDCPRCGVKHMTFDVKGANYLPTSDWRREYELQCRCRECKKSTLFVAVDKDTRTQKYVEQYEIAAINGSLNDFLYVRGYVNLKDNRITLPPPDLPPAIEKVFVEGATCLAVDCYNAAGTMFRLCMDLATKSMLPEVDSNGLNNKIRRNLGFRLPWLFAQNLLPQALQELSLCVKEDGNDGAHEGTLQKADAEDLLDFASVLLERIYSEPAQLERARERREARRAG